MAQAASQADQSLALAELPGYDTTSPDPETLSVLSSAPSYASDRPPSYHRPGSITASSEHRPSVDRSRTNVAGDDGLIRGQPRPQGLPALQYAPWLTCRGQRASVRSAQDDRQGSDMLQGWTSLRSGNGVWQHQQQRSPSSATSAPPGQRLAAGTNAPGSAAVPSPSSASHPHEDAALVGEQAAARAKAQRLYREAAATAGDDDDLRHESKSWDFMLAQMADWDERARSWAHFRRESAPAGGGRARLRVGSLGGRRLRVGGAM